MSHWPFVQSPHIMHSNKCAAALLLLSVLGAATCEQAVCENASPKDTAQASVMLQTRRALENARVVAQSITDLSFSAIFEDSRSCVPETLQEAYKQATTPLAEYTSLGNGTSCRGEKWSSGGWPKRQSGVSTVNGCATTCSARKDCTAFDFSADKPIAGQNVCWLFGHSAVQGDTDGYTICYEKTAVYFANVYQATATTTTTPATTTTKAPSTPTTTTEGSTTTIQAPTIDCAGLSLDAGGFKDATSLCCPQSMEVFFTCLIESMGLNVCSKPHVQGLMHWFSCVPDMDFSYMLDVINNGNPCKYWGEAGKACPALSAQCAGTWCR